MRSLPSGRDKQIMKGQGNEPGGATAVGIGERVEAFVRTVVIPCETGSRLGPAIGETAVSKGAEGP